jgi:small ligand-binding sensory domain FIST
MEARAGSYLLQGTFSEEGVITAAVHAREQIGGNAALGFLFATEEWVPHLEDTLELVRLHGRVSQLVGCSAWGTIGRRTELERRPGLSLLLLAVPPTCFEVFSFGNEDSLPVPTANSGSEVSGWVVLGRPGFNSLEDFVSELNAAYPGVPIVGGLASASSEETFLLHDGRVESAPILAVRCHRPLLLRWLVSQGCRPIGEPLPITKAEGNLIIEIGNIPAYQALETAFLSIPAEERVAVKNNLFVGLAVSEYVEEFRRGDFLVRNILGADPQAGALAIGDYPRVGRTIQFQLRDARSAHEDLSDQAILAAKSLSGLLGTVLFSCAGRGRNLFGTRDHDAIVLADRIGDCPLAGFFCSGEIGPVGDQTYLHGYTASAAMFCLPT